MLAPRGHGVHVCNRAQSTTVMLEWLSNEEAEYLARTLKEALGDQRS